MLIGIRVDASLKMGTGHTYRMLTLAQQLSENGHKVFFVVRRLSGHLIDLVARYFPVVELEQPPLISRCDSGEKMSLSNHCPHASWLEVSYENEIEQTQAAVNAELIKYGADKLDWLIVDNYAIEKTWQQALKPYSKRIFQVDDLADREHDVEALLDQNYYLKGELRYDGLLPSSAKRLCGPDFALLREEFFTVRQSLLDYTQRLADKHVVLFFGGIDIVNETSKALSGLLMVDSADHFDVIIGINNPHREQIESLCQKNSERVTLHLQVSNMMDFFAHSYLYVGAVGATTWERCVMALPGIVCSVADNQTQVAQDLNQINGHFYLGLSGELVAEDYRDAYQGLLNNKELLTEQSKTCAALVDGLGCRRVVEQLEEIAEYDEV